MTRPTITSLMEEVEALKAQMQAIPVKAPREPRVEVALPETPELLALQGQCNPSAQRLVESHARRHITGKEDMAEYVAKLETFCTNPARPSARLRYARGMFTTIKGGAPTNRKARKGKAS